MFESSEINSSDFGDGLELKGDILAVDEAVWEIEERAVVTGLSGVKHTVDYYLKSKSNRTIIITKADADIGAIYSAIGKLQVLKEDLDPTEVFVACQSKDLLGTVSKMARQVGIRVISKLEPSSAKNGFSAKNNSILGRGTLSSRNSAKKLRRDHTHLILEIMSLLRDEKSRITNIIYKCNLNHKTATNLIDELIEKGYLRIVESEESEKAYLLTREGSEALRTLERFYG